MDPKNRLDLHKQPAHNPLAQCWGYAKFLDVEYKMKDWIENPFKAVFAGTLLLVFVAAVLALGIGGVGIFV